MIRFAPALFLFAAATAAPLCAQDAGSFQLPPSTSAPADNRTQGPVDPDAPVPTRPRAIETARPTPTPAPSAATPSIVLPVTQSPRAAPQQRRSDPNPVAGSPRTDIPAPATSAPLPTVAVPVETGAPSPQPANTTAASPVPVAPTTIGDEDAQLPWLWVGLAGLALAAAGAFVFRHRREATATPPAIIAPIVPGTPAPSADALAIAVEAVRMDRSLMNATVGYRVTVRNRTAQALNDLAIEADLVSASGDRPAEQQLATPAKALTPRHAMDRLAPGQSIRFEGQVRLPLSEASAIWQGRVGLLVPLLRVRAIAAAADPVATTLVIGRTEGSTARPQPFRFDEPPRSYAPLAQRVLDAVPARA